MNVDKVVEQWKSLRKGVDIRIIPKIANPAGSGQSSESERDG